mmetsp:Transcript_108358/g.315018  ORF Transcript_108358/g.315018 Transcript_108358/m.315018 type:complete len:211 (-) Transcript_108358:504-1136(-)
MLAPCVSTILLPPRQRLPAEFVAPFHFLQSVTLHRPRTVDLTAGGCPVATLWPASSCPVRSAQSLWWLPPCCPFLMSLRCCCNLSRCSSYVSVVDEVPPHVVLVPSPPFAVDLAARLVVLLSVNRSVCCNRSRRSFLVSGVDEVPPHVVLVPSPPLSRGPCGATRRPALCVTRSVSCNRSLCSFLVRGVDEVPPPVVLVPSLSLTRRVSS